VTALPERLALVKPGPEKPEHAARQAGDPALEPLLTAADVAKVLGVRPKRVYELAIPAVKLSERSLRWRPSQLAAWIHERESAT
jgi:predicted DNA-binding transcriptional regulator AlpA